MSFEQSGEKTIAMAQRILGAVDAVAERHNWKKNLEWGNFYGRFNNPHDRIAGILHKAAELGVIWRSHPSEPDCILLNLRAIRELDQCSRGFGHYRKVGDALITELLTEAGFSDKKLKGPLEERVQWMRGTGYAPFDIDRFELMARHRMYISHELPHVEFPFAAVVCKPADIEPPLVWIRDRLG